MAREKLVEIRGKEISNWEISAAKLDGRIDFFSRKNGYFGLFVSRLRAIIET